MSEVAVRLTPKDFAPPAFDHQPPRYDEERAGAGMMLCQ